MLRRNIRSSVFVLLALAACTNKNNVKITGEIKEAENQKVYLEQLNVDQAVIIDSTKTDRNGHFTFKTTTSLPTFYNVKIGPKEFITFIAEPEDHIELSGTLNGLSQNYWVDGSENSLWVKLLNFQLNNTHVMTGTIVTDMTSDVRADEKNANAVLKAIAMRRFGQVEDIAGSALFLASDAAGYITGVNIPVDGGMLLN